MTQPQPTHSQPGGFQEKTSTDDMVVNDSLGTVDIADSTGLDKTKETDDERHGFVKQGGGDPKPQD